MKKTTSATQFSPSAIVKRPVGGMWKKLNASALASAVAAPEPAAPDRGDEQHGEEVDDAERDDRGDLGQRVDQRGGRRHRERGDGGADGGRAPVRARREP